MCSEDIPRTGRPPPRGRVGALPVRRRRRCRGHRRGAHRLHRGRTSPPVGGSARTRGDHRAHLHRAVDASEGMTLRQLGRVSGCRRLDNQLRGVHRMLGRRDAEAVYAAPATASTTARPGRPGCSMSRQVMRCQGDVLPDGLQRRLPSRWRTGCSTRATVIGNQWSHQTWPPGPREHLSRDRGRPPAIKEILGVDTNWFRPPRESCRAPVCGSSRRTTTRSSGRSQRARGRHPESSRSTSSSAWCPGAIVDMQIDRPRLFLPVGPHRRDAQGQARGGRRGAGDPRGRWPPGLEFVTMSMLLAAADAGARSAGHPGGPEPVAGPTTVPPPTATA